MNGKTFEPGQGNNAYIFPGVALGTICTGIHHISEDVFLSAAEALADMVSTCLIFGMYDMLTLCRRIVELVILQVSINLLLNIL